MASNLDLKTLNLKNVDFGAIKNFLLNFLIPIISVTATLVLVLFVLRPSYKNMPNLETDLSSKRRLAQQLNQKVTDLEFLVDYEQVLSEKSLLVNEALISQPEIPELLAQIDRMVKESGMTISQLNYSSIEESLEEIEYSSVGVALSIKGSPGQLLSFLKIIENASRLVLVKDFRYSVSTEAGSASSEVEVSFELLAPYLFVTSEAVTDESIDIDVSSAEFQELTDKLKSLKHYDVSSSGSVVSETPESSPSESPTPGGEVPGGEPASPEPEIEVPDMPPIEPVGE